MSVALPSLEDMDATGSIARALGLVNVHLLDHFILTDTEYFSMRDANRLPIYDFTGVIGISGERQGCVYFTAHRDLLRQLLLHVGEADVSDNNLCDLVGEIANTISGNARRHFGPNFMISVPVVVAGNAQPLSFAERGLL